MPDGTAAPPSQQTIGDCQVVVCTGQGPSDTRSDPDNSDVPADSNECTIGVCNNGNPGSINSQSGTPCTGGTCDGNGHCVP